MAPPSVRFLLMSSLLLLVSLTFVVAYMRWCWRQYPRRAVVANVFLCAVLLNSLWEVGQLPLFAGFADFRFFAALRHCAWYTLSDATIIICLYTLGAWRHRTWGWGLRLHRLDWLWLPCAGILVAMVIKRLALDVGRWQYSPSMPILPGLEVGLLPVLQMGSLPLLSVLLAGRSLPNVTRETSDA